MKNFLLYFGNDRAGSTWLHGELSKRTDCRFAPQKELFYFQDFFPSPTGFDRSKYFQYHEELASPENVILSGDVTPSNAYATKEQLYRFKEKMQEHSFNVLPVMTLRDPISHAMSFCKLQLSVREFLKTNSHDKLNQWVVTQLVKKTPSADPANVDELLQVAVPSFDRLMIPWRETVENVEEVFGKIYFNFYEILFTDDSVNDLFSYLGIPYQPVNYTDKVFTFGPHKEITDEEKLELFEKYPNNKENYNFAVERFGKGFIESIWWTPYK